MSAWFCRFVCSAGIGIFGSWFWIIWAFFYLILMRRKLVFFLSFCFGVFIFLFLSDRIAHTHSHRTDQIRYFSYLRFIDNLSFFCLAYLLHLGVVVSSVR